MFLYDRIVWQPCLHATPDLGILLDGELARKAYEQDPHAEHLNMIGEKILRRHGFAGVSPYIFDKGLVRQINVDAGEGKWLALDGMRGQVPDFSRTIEYSTHNFGTLDDTLCLLKLFDEWIQMATVLSKLD